MTRDVKPRSRTTWTLFLLLVSLGIVAASTVLLGAMALSSLEMEPGSMLGFGVAFAAAFLVVLTFPFLVAAKLIRWFPGGHRPSMTFGSLIVWNAVLVGCGVGLVPDASGTALAEYGHWVTMGHDVPALRQGTRAAAGLWCDLPEANTANTVPAVSGSTPLPGSSTRVPEAATPGKRLTPKELFAARKASVVVIKVQRLIPEKDPTAELMRRFGQKAAEGMGSGFLVSNDGLIITNHHVMKDAERAVVMTIDGRELAPVTVLAEQPVNDLALLKIPGTGFATAPLAEREAGAVGESAYAIGAPLGLDYTLTDGLISATRMIDGTSCLQMQTVVAPGSSGSPLLDDTGRVIGVNTAHLYPGLNLAVGVRHVHDLLIAPRQPRVLAAYQPGVNVDDLVVEGVEVEPTARMQLVKMMEALASILGECIKTHPPDATVKLRMSPETRGFGLNLDGVESTPGTEVDGCMKGKMDEMGMMVWASLRSSGLNVNNKRVVIVARVNGLSPSILDAGRNHGNLRLELHVNPLKR